MVKYMILHRAVSSPRGVLAYFHSIIASDSCCYFCFPLTSGPGYVQSEELKRSDIARFCEIPGAVNLSKTMECDTSGSLRDSRDITTAITHGLVKNRLKLWILKKMYLSETGRMSHISHILLLIIQDSNCTDIYNFKQKVVQNGREQFTAFNVHTRILCTYILRQISGFLVTDNSDKSLKDRKAYRVRAVLTPVL